MKRTVAALMARQIRLIVLFVSLVLDGLAGFGLRCRKNSVAIMAMLALTSIAQADPITIFNTGVNDSGLGLGGLAIGDSDLHYDIIGVIADPKVVRDSPYVANNATSQWIWENANGFPIFTTLTFRTTFDLTGLDPATAVLNGMWGTDNQGLDIMINGVSTGITLLGIVFENFTALHSFSIGSGFVPGLNTLDFVVQDNGVIGAFRAELTGTANVAAIPEPETYAMMLAGLGLLGFFARRRKQDAA